MKNLVQHKPLLAFFVLSYGLFWLFLALCAVVLLNLGFEPATLPSWLSPLLTILGARRFDSPSMGLFNFVFPLDGILLLSYHGVWLLLAPISTGWLEALPLAA